MAKNFDEIKFTIEALSGGKNTVLFDDLEMPSVMVPFPKFKISDVIEGSENIHPAFSVNSVEKDVIYVSKFQNIVVNDRAYSLAGKDPRTSVNFDQALKYCRDKGKGWCLMPYSLWCAIALWCKKNNTMPRGNNDYGQDKSYPLEKGVPTGAKDQGKTSRVLTGSGPDTWAHNWQPDGIFDLNGNVWEWCAGMRLKDGEIQIIPYSNVFDAEVSNGAESSAWKAISKTGTLVDPGTAEDLKWDWISNKLTLTTDAVSYKTDEGKGHSYKDMGIKAELTAPEIAKALLLYPDEPGKDVYGGDYHWANVVGERLPVCGGSWGNGASAGVFSVNLGSLRSTADGTIGFRSAFCDL